MPNPHLPIVTLTPQQHSALTNALAYLAGPMPDSIQAPIAAIVEQAFHAGVAAGREQQQSTPDMPQLKPEFLLPDFLIADDGKDPARDFVICLKPASLKPGSRFVLEIDTASPDLPAKACWPLSMIQPSAEQVAEALDWFAQTVAAASKPKPPSDHEHN